MREVYEQRREAVRRRMKERNIDSLLILYPSNRYYLSGFELFDPQCNESAGCLFLTLSGRDFLCTDSRYLEAARRVWEEEDIFIYSGNRLEQLRDFIFKQGVRCVGFEEKVITYEMYDSLSEEIPLVPCGGLVEELRCIKDEKEIELMALSCDINHEVLQSISLEKMDGLTEREVAWRIECLFREKGAEEMAFSPIVAWGKNSALPHYNPGLTTIGSRGPLLVDVGGRYCGYCSDQTRTLWIGEDVPSFFLDTLELVKRAQQLAIERLKVGMEIRQLYFLVKDFFEENGVGDRFIHALGHGIGLDTHEAPAVGPRNNNIFRPNMVVTIEPGLYFPEWGGVRWEHMVVVTEEGARVL